MLSTGSAASGAGMDGAGPGIPLRPTAFGGDQRLQRLAHVRVPAHRFHPASGGSTPANSEGMWQSLANSAVVGLGATAIALVLGTMAAFAVQRYDFFGKQRREFPCGAADYAARASSPASR